MRQRHNIPAKGRAGAQIRNKAISVSASLLICLAIQAAWAADSFWTNTASGNFTNTANWSAGVPGAADNANFTNNANYTVSWTSSESTSNAFFNAKSGIVTQAIGSSVWSLPGSYIVGQNAGTTASVTHTSGTLAVTNASGTAALVIGQSGKGTYKLDGGVIYADNLFVTNGANSTLTLRFGTLNTLQGSSFNGSFTVGDDGTAFWNIMGGTNGGTGVQFNIGGNTFQTSTGTVFITGPNTVLTNIGKLVVGQGTKAFGTLILTNGAQAYTGGDRVTVGDNGRGVIQVTGGSTLFTKDVGGVGTQIGGGGAPNSSDSSVLVSGTDSKWIGNATAVEVGRDSARNELAIKSGGLVTNVLGISIGVNSSARSNTVTVSGTNSRLYANSAVNVGFSGSDSSLVVSNGGRVQVVAGQDLFIGRNASSTNNSATLTGNGTFVIAATIRIGDSGISNRLSILDGAVMENGAGTPSYIGFGAGSVGNSVLVSGAGSTWSNKGQLVVGRGNIAVAQGQGDLVVSNGGLALIRAGGTGLGAAVGGALDSSVLVTGSGSAFRDSFAFSTPSDWATLYVGSNQVTTGTGHLRLEQGGTLEFNRIVSGFGSTGSITNSGGIMQFTTATPSITNNNFAGGSIVVSDGTISFRLITNANPSITGTVLTNVTFVGNNTFMLNNASNTSLATYTFAPGSPSTTYQRLALANGGRWQSTNLTVASGGALIGNGTVASPNVTNLGTIAPGFSAGSLTFTNNLVLGTSSRLEMEIGGTNAVVDYDQLSVGGNVTVTGTLAVGMINLFSPTVGDSFRLIDNQGTNAIFGQFNGLTNNAFLDASGNGANAFFRIQYDGGTGNDLVLIATIPEPSAMLLLSAAAGVWFGSRRFRGER